MKIISFLILFLLPTLVFAQTDYLISFELEDQFSRVHTHQDYLGKFTILIGSDGGGSKYNGKWGTAIDHALKNDDIKYQISWLPVADVSSAPFFMKGYVRSQFPEDQKEWALCDWEGEFDEAYGFEGNMSNILVFDNSGKLLHRCVGTEVDIKMIEEIVAVVKNNY